MAAQVIAEKEKLENGQTTDEEPLTVAFNYFELRRRLLYDLKSKVISTWMDTDRQRDYLVARNPIPQNVRCQVCGSKMVFGTHIFKNDDQDIFFAFSCPKGHLPKQMHYPDGTLFIRKPYIPKCVMCGSDVLSTTSKNGSIITFTDNCNRCRHVESWEIDDSEDEEPIDEADRKRYCTDQEDISPLMQGLATHRGLKPLLDIFHEMEQSAKKNELYRPN